MTTLLSFPEQAILMGMIHSLLEHHAGEKNPTFALPPAHGLPEGLRRPAACFATLHKEGRLRGCMGTLEANEGLAASAMRSAFNAAFKDPRFEALTPSELGSVDLRVSVLTSPEPIEFSNLKELEGRIKPDSDGLLLKLNQKQVTFLPDVWQSLPDPAQFVSKLLEKGEFSKSVGPPQLKAYRYQTQSIDGFRKR